jgi:hypothetical protein
MRSVIITAMSAFVTLAIVSIGYAQSDQRAPEKPTDQSTDRVLAPNIKKPTAAKDSSVLRITPEQEKKIPYRPCTVNVRLADGRSAGLYDK